MICASLILLLLSCGGGPHDAHLQKDLLRLESQIPLAGVHGRIDHLSYDAAGHRLFVAALGDNSVEIVDLAKKTRLQSIAGLDEPQGVAYISSLGRLVVAGGGTGDCVFYDGRFTELGRIALRDDADNIRYDPATKMLYVGYGKGGIAVIDPAIIKQLSNLPLKGHPESFQFDDSGRLLINIPDRSEIVLAGQAALNIRDHWKNIDASANFPMALDKQGSRLFVGYRHPAEVKALDCRTGAVLATLPCVGDADDMFYDEADSLLLVTGGDGYIDIFRNDKLINHIPTRKGARTSLWLPAEKRLIVAVPERRGEEAAIWVYGLAGM